MSMKYLKLNAWRVTNALFLSAALVTVGPVAAKKSSKPAAAKPGLRKVSYQPDATPEFINFSQWKEVSAFIDDMVARHGFERAQLETLFREIRHVDSAIQLVKPAPPGKPKNWKAYRARFVEPIRIAAGVKFWNENADALERAEKTYGVPAEIIVGIIGVETIYGRNTGNFRVLDALTTLAFNYPETPNRERRMAFFKSELEQTLLFAREANIEPFSLLGSYAGAVGWPQFMPGTIRRYAIDFDNDGHIDLRNSPIDAIGSVANFLVQHGWQTGDPIAFPATVTTSSGGDGNGNRWESFLNQGLDASFKLEDLTSAGITPVAGLPETLQYGLVDLQNGTEATEYWLGTANFFAIAKYNRSFFYAMSVIELGRAVKAARG
jgi:membrane-bound lytic murein transglycosylase B